MTDVTSYQKNPLRILLVDDDPASLALICAYFEGCDYEIITATNGVEAEEIIHSHADDYFSLYLFDYRMPKKDGIQLLIDLKKDSRYKMVPAILQTSADSQEDIQRGIQAGAFYYLLKPFTRAHLCSIVEAAIKGFTNHQQINRQIKSFPKAAELLKRAHFGFKTIEQAKDLATTLAFLTPDPQQTGIGLFELMINAIEHGNLGIGYDEKTRLIKTDRLQQEIQRRLNLPENLNKSVKVELTRHEDRLDISIEDMGIGFDPKPYMEFSLERAMDNHGRGIMMANQLSFDRLHFSNHGRKVTCSVKLDDAYR
ncbi:response regulator [Thiomicrorhabdus chilensis]|uniref:response regulator n=1 Tax=Thiomicrorhabdus chilensis TaxID=63656 RepID=UPI00042570C6|nr:response regulator [Thiomicrorhabdus chilensis]